MANLKEVPVQELLDELFRRVEAEMIRFQPDIEAQEHEKRQCYTNSIRSFEREGNEYRAKRNKGTNH
jgi:hypothetical protein